MSQDDELRAQLVRALDWEEAHVGFRKAFEGVPAAERGARATGFEHSLWQLLEHLRIAQQDILEFCVNPEYVHTRTWPDDYWPADPAPPDDASWEKSLRALETDLEGVARLIRDDRVELLARVPTGKGGQTFLRALLLIVDHNAYHLGQAVAVRRALGIWSS
jgi:uncharacterized damage-inducible protein DinB